MIQEVRKIYYEAGKKRLSYSVNKLLKEVYPEIKCYIVDALNFDKLIRSFFSYEDRKILYFILRKNYPLKGSKRPMEEIAKEYFYYTEITQRVLNELKSKLLEKENIREVFNSSNYLIPDLFIDASIAEIYKYISCNIESFKDNINLYQIKILERLLYYPKIKKSLAVFIYEYLLLIRGYAFPRIAANNEIEREYRIYVDGERELKKYGLENILDLLKDKDVSIKVKRYLFQEYSQYIIGLLSNSDIITENLLQSYDRDSILVDVISNKEKKEKKEKSIKELNLSTMAYNCLIKAKYKYISQIPKTEKEIALINKIGKVTAKEIFEKLERWYKDNREDIIDIDGKDIELYCVGFSARVYNALRRVGYKKISDIPTAIEEIKEIPKLGKISVDEVVTKLKEYNISVY